MKSSELLKKTPQKEKEKPTEQAKDKEQAKTAPNQGESEAKVVSTTQEGTPEPSTPAKKKRGEAEVTLFGKIRLKKKEKVYWTKSPNYNKVFYKLDVEVESLGDRYQAPRVIYAFKDTIVPAEGLASEHERKRREQIWAEIEADYFLGKTYLLKTLWTTRGFKLYDWEQRESTK